MTETSLAAWLREHGESPYAFSRRVGIYIQTAYALCGIRSSKTPTFLRTKTLERIALETGIPVLTLFDDWAKAEPRQPRKYTKRESDGITAE